MKWVFPHTGSDACGVAVLTCRCMLPLLLRAGRICRRHSPPAVEERLLSGRGQHPLGEAWGAGAAGHPLGTATEQQWDPAGSRYPCYQAHTSLITIPQGLSQTLTLKN